MSREPAKAATGSVRPAAGDTETVRALLHWFRIHARELPWRESTTGDGSRDPYRVMVSEFMLQQTQVPRVIERFGVFLERFPTLRHLAEAREQDVLAVWSGLGYYRRARLLHRAAGAVLHDHAGEFPADTEALRNLPGVGAYTAAAISAFAFRRAAPVVDANVARVLLRIRGKPAATSDPRALAWAREEADGLNRAAGRKAATLSEAIMELGALICTARTPKCESCPVARACVARKKGWQDRIPTPKKAAAKKEITHACAVVATGRGVLLERRGEEGLWASMWQCPTLELEGPPAPGLEEGLQHIGFVPRGEPLRFVHKTTHRTVHFAAWSCTVLKGGGKGREYAPRERLAGYGLSTPQRRIITHFLAQGRERT